MRPALVIALPLSQIPEGRFPNKLLRFGKVLSKMLPSHEVRFSWPTDAKGAHAFNLAIDEFRLDPQNEWLFFWDTKIEITPKDIALMVGEKVGVVGALYETGEPNSRWQAGFYPDLKAGDNGLLAVPELEAGAKLYHRSVFDKIEEKRKDLNYIFDNSGRSIPAFCQEAPISFGEYKRMLNPALFLDSLCREAGVWIYAHTKVILAKGKGPYRPWEHTRLLPPDCAEELPEAPEDKRDIKIFIPYCLKDQKKAEDLKFYLEDSCGLLADLVYSHGDKYPKGPNETALIIMREAGVGKFNMFMDYKAFMMVEPDCCPMTTDWIDQLSASWDRAAAAGKLIMGSWHPINIDHPTLGHINGNLMFSPDLAKRITIPDVPDDKPWDTYLADVFQPYWCRTGLIKNLNRHRTASRDQLTKPECGTRPPVLVHGVRDESAWNLAKENGA